MGNACICGQEKKLKNATIIKNNTNGEEKYKPVSLKITMKVIKSICKIIIKNNKGIFYRTGFFIKISETLKFLFTHYQIINPDIINEYIEIEVWNKEKMNLNIDERKMKYFKKPKDITVIEIKETDQIFEYIEFLDYDINYFKGNLMYKNMDIFTINNPFGDEISSINGLILKINDNNEFEHNISIDKDSAGCPVILLNNYINLIQVIGIINVPNNENKINSGIFVNKIIKEIKNGLIIENSENNIKNDLINSNKEDSDLTKNEKANLIEISKDNSPKNINVNIINEQQEITTKNENNNLKKLKNKKTRKNKNNSITAEIYIKKEDIDKEIRIINSFEEYMRYHGGNIKKISEDIKNEKEIKECEIKINDELIKFNYFYKFKKEGKYIIKYIFKDLLSKIHYLFYNCSFLVNIDLSNFNDEKIINMSNMFNGCSSLISINFIDFYGENVRDMSYLFYQCKSLERINLKDFDTEKVINMRYMFCNCSSLQSLDLSQFNTINVTDMCCMFCGCSSLNEINISNFYTQNVTIMNHMFSFCSSLINLDLSHFNTQNALYMEYMFYNCSSLESLNLSNFNTNNIPNALHYCNQKDFSCLFYGCKALKGNVITDDNKINEIVGKLNN